MFTKCQVSALVLLALVAIASATREAKEARTKVAGGLAMTEHFAKLRPENNACMVCTMLATIVGMSPISRTFSSASLAEKCRLSPTEAIATEAAPHPSFLAFFHPQLHNLTASFHTTLRRTNFRGSCQGTIWAHRPLHLKQTVPTPSWILSVHVRIRRRQLRSNQYV